MLRTPLSLWLIGHNSYATSVKGEKNETTAMHAIINHLIHAIVWTQTFYRIFLTGIAMSEMLCMQLHCMHYKYSQITLSNHILCQCKLPTRQSHLTSNL